MIAEGSGGLCMYIEDVHKLEAVIVFWWDFQASINGTQDWLTFTVNWVGERVKVLYDYLEPREDHYSPFTYMLVAKKSRGRHVGNKEIAGFFTGG
jgi:hypothetical protein